MDASMSARSNTVKSMQFTPHETKLIERLRKREKRWPRDRWIILTGAALTLVGYAYVLFRLIAMLKSDSFTDLPGATALIVAFLWPKCLFGFCLGSILLGLAIRDWHGNVQRMLLLKLLEEQQKKDGN